MNFLEKGDGIGTEFLNYEKHFEKFFKKNVRRVKKLNFRFKTVTNNEEIVQSEKSDAFAILFHTETSLSFTELYN